MKCMCWICWENAVLKYEVGDWQNIACDGCGRYLISKHFMQENVGNTADVEVMRQLIKDSEYAGLIPAVIDGTARYALSSRHRA